MGLWRGGKAIVTLCMQRHTKRHDGWGTFGYMSPEQYDPSKEITHLSDAYSAAATLSHLATGQEPFTGLSMAQVMFAVCMHGTKPQMPESVPEPLRSAALRALERDPAQRASVADMLAAARECRRVRAGHATGFLWPLRHIVC